WPGICPWSWRIQDVTPESEYGLSTARHWRNAMNPMLTLFRFGRGHRSWWNAQLDRITREIAAWFARPVPVRVRAPRLWLLALALAMIAGASSGARAQEWRQNDYGYAPIQSDRTANGNLVDVQMLVRGRPAPLYLRRGTDRWYFQAFKGRNYSLR